MVMSCWLVTGTRKYLFQSLTLLSERRPGTNLPTGHVKVYVPEGFIT